MKSSLKYIFLFPLVALAVWIGFSHLYIAGNLFDRFTTTRGTYIYLVVVPSILKKVPEIGMTGKAEFSSWPVDGTKSGGESISYASKEQPEVLTEHIQHYLISQGYAPCQTSTCHLQDTDSHLQTWVPADPQDPHWIEFAVTSNEPSSNKAPIYTVWVSYNYF